MDANLANACLAVLNAGGYYGDPILCLTQQHKTPFIGQAGEDDGFYARSNGNYFSNHYSHEEQRPEVQNFVANYKKKWGSTPDGLAALGYDAVRLWADAVKRAGSLDPKAVRDQIAATQNYDGVSGMTALETGVTVTSEWAGLSFESSLQRQWARENRDLIGESRISPGWLLALTVASP